MHLSDQAKLKAMEGAAAEWMSTLSMSYAHVALNGNIGSDIDTNINNVITHADLNKPATDDFSYGFTAADDGIEITVTGTANLDMSLKIVSAVLRPSLRSIMYIISPKLMALISTDIRPASAFFTSSFTF